MSVPYTLDDLTSKGYFEQSKGTNMKNVINEAPVNMPKYFEHSTKYLKEISFGANTIDLYKKIFTPDDNTWKTEVDGEWMDLSFIKAGFDIDISDPENSLHFMNGCLVVAAGFIRRTKQNPYGILYFPTWSSHSGIFIDPKAFVDKPSKDLAGGLQSWYKKFYVDYKRLVPGPVNSFILCEANDNKEFVEMMLQKFSNEIQENVLKVSTMIAKEFAL